MSLNLIKASNKHYALLAYLGAETFYQAFKAHQSEEDLQYYIAKTYNLNAVKSNLQNKDIIYYTAYNQQGEAGYIKLIKNVSAPELNYQVMELEKIYVLQNLWNTKAGAALMNEAIAETKLHQFKALYLGVWQENHRAINFYKKFGFKTVGTRTFQLGSTLCHDYMMALEV